MKMNIDEFNKLLLEAVGIGLVIASYPELDVIYHNNRVLEWFPSFDEGSEAVSGRLVGIDQEALYLALDSSQTYRKALEVKVRRRVKAIDVMATRASIGDAHCVIFELYDNTKVLELETMITSYSKMIEQQNRSLQREKERA